MEKRLMVALSLLVLVASAAHAQPAPMPDICEVNLIENYWQGRFGSWQDLCMLGMLISFFVMSILYMLSQAFSIPGLSAWCKKEFFQVAVTGVIVAGLVGFVLFSCTFVKPSLFIDLDDDGDGIPDHPDDLFAYSINYVEWLRDSVYTLYVFISVVNSLVTTITGTVVYASPGGFGVNLRPMGGFNTISGMLTFSMSTLFAGGILTSIAQLRVLHAIQLMAFNILLPIGVFARCFEPTRRFGGSLMAIAIGLFLFYPFMLMLNAAITHNVLEIGDSLVGASTEIQNIDPSITSLENSLDRYVSMQTDSDYNKPPDLDASNDPIPGTEGQGYGLLAYVNNLFLVLYVLVGKILLAALFLPFFNFIMLIVFIRNLSRMLGEEVDITNITRMI
jgi:hypothetical protein